MGKIGQARGFLFFRIVNKFFFRKRKKNKKQQYGMDAVPHPLPVFLLSPFLNGHALMFAGIGLIN